MSATETMVEPLTRPTPLQVAAEVPSVCAEGYRFLHAGARLQPGDERTRTKTKHARWRRFAVRMWTCVGDSDEWSFRRKINPNPKPDLKPEPDTSPLTRPTPEQVSAGLVTEHTPGFRFLGVGEAIGPMDEVACSNTPNSRWIPANPEPGEIVSTLEFCSYRRPTFLSETTE